MEQYPEAGGMALAASRSYAIVVEWAEGNYSAYAPDLPGCVTTGATVEETIAGMREAIAGHLTLMAEHGDPIPEPRAVVARVEVAA